jgi:hypothetical protein
MNTQNLFSACLILKDLSMVLLHVSFVIDQKNIRTLDAVQLKSLIDEYWTKSSSIVGVDIQIYPDWTNSNMFTVSANVSTNPMAVISIDFHLGA